MQDIVGTFQQLRNSPIVLLSIILFGVEVLAIAGITRLGIPAYAIQILQGGPQVYSILVSGMAFGTVIGALLVGRLPIKTYALWIFACWMLYGTFLTLLPMTSWFPLAVVLTILTGGVGAFVDVLMALLIQCKVPKEKIGKVFSLWSTVANMSEAASSPLVGFLLGAFRLVPVFVGCGLMTAIFGLLSLFKVMQVKSVKSLNEIQS